MQGWKSDPAYRAVEQAFVDGDPLDQVGGGLDVRAVVAALRPEAGGGFMVEQVPWERFPEGGRVRRAVEQLRSDDAGAVSAALDLLGGLCANDMRAAAVPAVPFLVRIGADPHAHHRIGALAVAAALARWWHHGVCTRADMLRFRYSGDEWGFEVTGYPGNWSVQAARDAIATDADLLLPLLDDPDPGVRIATAYVLAAASDRAREVRTAFRSRLLAEPDPAVRAGLVLAAAQLALAHQDAEAPAWTRAYWSDSARPPEVRVSAALGWMCLTDVPVPDDLRTVLDDLATDETARLMAPLPWMRAAEDTVGNGLQRCLRKMLDPDAPDTENDPWS
ncbi:hypothetical protein PV721_19345 [Streptomyces sp. MB09-01]|uniref:hypothetical protein n=1 Tax=Streptomyces sp. MB09-01 TaxID=3028666 RepID=UPI0029B26FD3|nr:hypothetical protein [Streptomyces sp. MB09-01]MDX3536494.1 hypothetical protein [Streptomyces sp. MB09-01]